ncbi:universal stress protein [Fictibacillus barbaricus]|nr:universal stress protein [Fictibacillus barbaricus]
MMLYRKILVAIDGSEGSIEALRNGSEIAKNSGAELTLLHVMHESPLPLYGGVYPLSVASTSMVREEVIEAEKAEQTHGEEILHKAQMQVPPEVETRTALLNGAPSDTICAYAERYNIDLIVIGSRGLTGLKKFVLGSVSQKVLHDANVPVLITK